jgi:hypothetical protein
LQMTEWARQNPLLVEDRFFPGLALVAGHRRYGSTAASEAPPVCSSSRPGCTQNGVSRPSSQPS